MLTYYEKIAPHLNEPLYTRTALQWCESLSLPVFSGGAGYSIVRSCLYLGSVISYYMPAIYIFLLVRH